MKYRYQIGEAGDLCSEIGEIFSTRVTRMGFVPQQDKDSVAEAINAFAGLCYPFFDWTPEHLQALLDHLILDEEQKYSGWSE